MAKVGDLDFEACDVELHSVLVWAIREQRLYGCDLDEKEFNIKLDGRPLGGACNEKFDLINLFPYTVPGDIRQINIIIIIIITGK